MVDTPDPGTGDSAPTYEELIRQTRLIYRELERYGLNERQLQEAWEPVEAVIFEALGRSDRTGQAVGRAALDAARQARARWIPVNNRPDD
ncbi:hypothetical protein [Actinomadura sp. K4S16]|uniref:hypothetical protein n=1 Tax=Actinomadura sp. K4S16 TaxID=1316147 RepID=UPI0011EC5F3B|nr:hypothetical protein [Actinomadura sp. K4S16]